MAPTDTGLQGPFAASRQLEPGKSAPKAVAIVAPCETTPLLKAQVHELKRRVKELTTENANSRRGKELALKDWLLGLPSRRAFEERLREEWARTRRSGRTFAVAMIDIDGLKQITTSMATKLGIRPAVRGRSPSLKVAPDRLPGALGW